MIDHKVVEMLLEATRGRENKNRKYFFWLGYALGAASTLTEAEKESKLLALLSKKGKITD